MHMNSKSKLYFPVATQQQHQTSRLFSNS